MVRVRRILAIRRRAAAAARAARSTDVSAADVPATVVPATDVPAADVFGLRGLQGRLSLMPVAAAHQQEQLHERNIVWYRNNF